MLKSFPPVANWPPLLLKSKVLMLFYSSRTPNSFFSVGICQYSIVPSQSPVTKVWNDEFVWGLHLKVVIGFWLTLLILWTILSVLLKVYVHQSRKWTYHHFCIQLQQVGLQSHIWWPFHLKTVVCEQLE